MNIALIAHDKKKDSMVEFAVRYKKELKKHTLFATGTTGTRISVATGLAIHKFRSGPLGGDQQIGAKISEGELDLVIFLRDPLTSQPHEPDVNALLRLCDVYSVPVATNLTSAHIMMDVVVEGIADFNQLRIDNE